MKEGRLCWRVYLPSQEQSEALHLKQTYKTSCGIKQTNKTGHKERKWIVEEMRTLIGYLCGGLIGVDSFKIYLMEKQSQQNLR